MMIDITIIIIINNNNYSILFAGLAAACFHEDVLSRIIIQISNMATIIFIFSLHNNYTIIGLGTRMVITINIIITTIPKA